MDTRKELLEMGFPVSRIEAALRHAGQDISECIEWLDQNGQLPNEKVWEGAQHVAELENQGAETRPQAELKSQTDTQVVAEAQEANETAGSAQIGDVAKDADSQTQTQPLTDEQKKDKLDKLKERAAARKAEQLKKDAIEQKQNSILRKKHDYEAIRAKEELQKKEAMKAAQKRRQEAKDDKLAKARIRDLIEADKKARREKAAGGSGLPEPPATVTRAPPNPASLASPAPAKPQATDTRLRIRIGNEQLVKTYPLVTTVGAVAESLAYEYNLSADRIVFKATFPTRKIGKSDFEKTLQEADLRNASLTVDQE